MFNRVAFLVTKVPWLLSLVLMPTVASAFWLTAGWDAARAEGGDDERA